MMAVLFSTKCCY